MYAGGGGEGRGRHYIGPIDYGTEFIRLGYVCTNKDGCSGEEKNWIIIQGVS